MNKSIPRHKRLKRKGRLQAARHWIPKYNGKNLVKGYSNHFGVAKLCAANELRMLGYQISDEYLAQLKASLVARQKEKEKRKREKELSQDKNLFIESDETFYYIAGYTSGGISYGITWEQYEEENRVFEEEGNLLFDIEETDLEDLPF